MRTRRANFSFFLAVFYFFGKTRGENSGRQRKHSDAQKSDKSAEDFPERRNRKNIAVTDGRQSHDAPPERRGNVGKFVGLRFGFETDTSGSKKAKASSKS